MDAVEITIEQLRANRRHALNAWLHRKDGGRWDGDDGRILKLDEFQFWPEHIKQSERDEFNRLDSIYEVEKAALKQDNSYTGAD
jgi:hypothetical protein